VANNLTSNITRKLMRVFLKAFESNRVVTKTVDTQLLSGKFTPSSGSTVDFKRPHDYRTHRTAGGDISAVTKSDIISGKATGTVQDYITAATEWENVEEALELDQLDQIINPMATRIVTDLEVDFAGYCMQNAALSHGAVGTPVASWSDVAYSGALMRSAGVPKDSPWYYLINPYAQVVLADVQKGLAGNDNLIATAWQKAQISRDFGGLQALTSDALASYTTHSVADRVGAVNGVPDATYVTHKDTMIQNVTVDGFGANLQVRAGDVVEITGPQRLNLSTRQLVMDQNGTGVPYRATVTAAVTLDGSGAGTLALAGPAIQEVNGQYNTVDAAIGDNDVITLLGAADTVLQPNLFYSSQAFGIGTVKLPKLFSTDTLATTKDGFSLRVSKYSDGDSNTQKVRFDLLPAYATFNPFFAGTGWG